VLKKRFVIISAYSSLAYFDLFFLFHIIYQASLEVPVDYSENVRVFTNEIPALAKAVK
jgi:hypothetical protein